MRSFEHVIVGSGPAGVAAARVLNGPGTVLIDAGEEPRGDFPFVTLEEALAAGDPRAVLGPGWEMLGNIPDRSAHHPKLRAHGIRHVAGGEPFVVTGPAGMTVVRGRGSHATGGFAGAWGGQLLRYTQADLAGCGDWPIGAGQLDPHYNALERHIGIAGAEDDAAEFLGRAAALMPPTPQVAVASALLRTYARRRQRCRSHGLRLGQPRLAVATEALDGVPAHAFGETEFFATDVDGLYTPRRTLQMLLDGGKLEYVPRARLVGFSEQPDAVALDILDTATGTVQRLSTRHLLLGCGVLHTAKLVLEARGETGRTLPFLDHPPTLLPLFFPSQFGRPLPGRSYPIQAVGCFEKDGERDMLSLYYPGGMLRSDLLLDLPLPIPDALGALKLLLGGMLVAQLWRPAKPAPRNRLGLDADGTIRIEYPDRPANPHVKALLAAFRVLGGYSLSRLASESPAGWGFHYAGTLPMRTRPSAFETHPDGRLWDSRRVRVIDGSVLPSLPAKTLSLTIMANAARIATEVSTCGY